MNAVRAASNRHDPPKFAVSKRLIRGQAIGHCGRDRLIEIQPEQIGRVGHLLEGEQRKARRG